MTSGEFASNAYLCDLGHHHCALIDGGLDPKAIDLAMQELGWTPCAMFCTHGHFDHAGSAAYMQNKYNIPVYLHGADRKLLKASNFLLMACKLASRIDQPSEITEVSDGQYIDIAGHRVRYHEVPGHTPGSCVIEFGTALFTGDTIYARGVGLSHLPGEDVALLKASILKFWPRLIGERTVYPGHGEWARGEDVRTSNKALLAFLGLSLHDDEDTKVFE